MTGALAAVSMPGLAAVAIGLALVGLGGLVLLVGLVLLAIAAARRELRPAGAGTAAAGLVLALGGAGLMLLGEVAGYGSAIDVAALVLGPLALAAAILAGRLVARALRPSPPGPEAGSPSP